MSCNCRPSTDLCDSCVELLGTGEEQERLRVTRIINTFHAEAHQVTRSTVCKPCRILNKVEDA